MAVLSGESADQLVHNFDDAYSIGDSLLLTVYDGTVMTIPDFSITPPASIVVPGSGTSPGPDFTVSRNKEFSSTVTLYLRGDHAGGVINPAWDLIPVEGTAPPAAGKMNEPIFSPQTFIPTTNGTRVGMTGLKTNAVPAGIYTIWLEGLSGNPTSRRAARLFPCWSAAPCAISASFTRACMPTSPRSAAAPPFRSG